MVGKVLSCAWLLVLLISMDALAADASGKLTFKGDMKEGKVELSYFGVGKSGKLDWGTAENFLGSGPKYTQKTVDDKTPMEIDGKGRDWTWSIHQLHPGFHLLRACFMPKGEHIDPATGALTEWQVPTYWKWIEVKDEKDKVTADFEVNLSSDPKEVGAIELSAQGGKKLLWVVFVPIDGLDLSSTAAKVVAGKDAANSTIHTFKLLKDAAPKLTLKPLPPGKYRVYDMKDESDHDYVDVDVKAGETAKAQLGGKK